MAKTVYLLGVGKDAMKKKRTEKQRLISLTRSMNRFFLLSCAYLSEEYGWGEDDVVNYYYKMNEWIDAMDKHFIKMETVAEIIERITGMRLYR